PAPGLAKFYLITDKDGKLKIFSGEMDPQLKAYFDARNDDADVQKLIKMTNDKSAAAKKKDGDLMKFWQDIDKMANSNDSKAKSNSNK
ncbi:MAG TPA: hypothetical protein VN131_02505, partial [Mobilitalea sp.]|nr:hypothetical protein [Mobilitalea sp.]